MTTIAEFYATLKLQPDRASIAETERWLKSVQSRLEKSLSSKGGLTGALFKVNKGQLERQIQGSLNSISTSATFHLNKFTVNQAALNHALGRAVLGASSNVKVPQTSSQRTTSSGDSSRNKDRGFLQNTSDGIHLSRTILGTAAAGFGLASLNSKMQELQNLPIALTAITGSPEKAQEHLSFLKRIGGNLGVTQADLVPNYSQFLASAQGTKLESQIPQGFESLTKYGKVMGLDSTSMKLSFKAFSQMIGKGQIMSEELKGQAAEHLPGVMQMMAKVAAGGDVKKLNKMMKSGELDPVKYLPLLFAEMDKVAARGWEAKTKTSQFQQDQSGVGFERLLMLMAQSGGNDALFRGWKSIAETLPKLEPIAKALGGAFEGLARGVEGVGHLLVGVADSLQWFEKQSPLVQTGIEGMGFAMAAFGTKTGKALLPLTALFLLLEDMAVYNQGGDSVIGRALNGKGGAMLAVGGLIAAVAGGGIPSINGNSTTETAKKFLFNPLTIAAVGAGAGALALNNASSDPAGGMLGPDFAMGGGFFPPAPKSSSEGLYNSLNESNNPKSNMNSGALFENMHLTINTPTNAPEEHAYLFMKKIDETMPNFHNAE